jgi:hypothetical protein
MKRLLLLMVSGVLFAQTQIHSVTLRWKDSANPPGTTYNVYKVSGACPSTAPTIGNFGSFVKINTAPVPTMIYQDFAVSPGNSYCYFVTAVSATAESAPSGEIGSGTVPGSLIVVKLSVVTQ